MTSPPLSSLLVISVEQAVAAPFATRQLADLGARVIKIERPDGGDFARGYDTTVNGLSSYFVWLNRSKESLALDLKDDKAAPVLDALLSRADVFVQNLAPGAVDRLGLGAAELRQRYPKLITCTISGYGSGGPLSNDRAYDLLVQSEVGLVSITGTPESASRVGISVADIAAGMYAYSSILAALIARGASGEGAAIEISLFDALAEWMSAPLYYAAYSGADPPRTGAHHPTVAPYGPFRCQDGETVYFGVQNPREWSRFCADVLQQPALASDSRFSTNPARIANRPALHAIVDTVLGQLPAAEVRRRLKAADIAHAQMRTVREFIEHPHLTARNRWHTIDSPAGPIRALAPPAQIEGASPVMGAVPSLGQHTAAILRELGLDSA